MRRNLLLLSCILGGCGTGAAGANYDAPLRTPLTITADVASSSVDTGPANLRGALVWTDPGQRLPATDVALQVHSVPSKFTLTITHDPPQQAITPLIAPGQPKNEFASVGVLDASQTSSATAYLVVYDDVNANGQLDLNQPGKPSPDRVLGIATDFIVYFEGQVPTFDPSVHNDGVITADPFFPKELGFHIYHSSGGELLPPKPGCDPNDFTTPNGCVQHAPMSVGWESIDSEISINLDGNPLDSWILDPSAVH